MNKDITYVTGIWDIGRSNLNEGFKRSYQDYLDRFGELLKTECNLFIYCSKNDNEFVWNHRDKSNTEIKNIELDELKTWFSFSEKVQEIRNNERWYNYSGWLKDSPQATLEHYNLIVMSKMFMLNDVSLFNPFNSEYFFWIDGGLTNTVSKGYFQDDKVLDYVHNFYDIEDKFLFLSFPYDGDREIHGFRKDRINVYSDSDNVSYVCRGGFFGGKKDVLNHMSSVYYTLTQNTLEEGLMGTEESIFTIMAYLYPQEIQRFELEGNGLVYKFFEHVKNNNQKPIANPNKRKKFKDLKVSLYVITYNSPRQFEELCKSIIEADEHFHSNTDLFLLNNSIDRETDKEYSRLCKEYNFTEIKKDNIGICGGRQFIAEHFYESDADYMFFFEDDMFLHPKDNKPCKNGFAGYVDDLYDKTLGIIYENEYDFLKMQYTELFGDNGTQWAWYNIPQPVREKYYPSNNKLPINGYGKNIPTTKFTKIKSKDGVSYIEGDVYYCNWPHVIGKMGTKKIFIDNKFEYPFEQTWMSLVFQMQKENKINAALLLASPVNHNRFEYYKKGERKEN